MLGSVLDTENTLPENRPSHCYCGAYISSGEATK